MKISRIAAGLAAAATIAGASALAAAPPAKKEAPAADFFTRQVQPILQQKCITCHSGAKPQGGLDLTSREAILKGGASGPAAAPGSLGGHLLDAVNFKGRRMPPQGKLPQEQIDVLTRWVESGMAWGDAELKVAQGHEPPKVTAEAKRFWSFQTPRRPLPPQVKNRWWILNPVDAFVMARLEKAGLKPNPTASRSALIRRVTYDLTGLPPTPEEVRAFEEDRSPDAWAKVVDRLLASPQYGVKWGRHWLDLVRYAESNSYERDGTKPNVWRYRDYVIDSFNADKPYDQFIVEQLAGDELPERTPERLIAAGYYRLGIWDDEPADPKQALYDDLDDIASTTAQVFLGVNMGCARCHDHKIDPIPQKDYYRFLAFFSGVQRYGVRSDESVAAASLRSIAPAEEQKAFEQQVAEHQAKVKANDEALAAIEAKVLEDLSPVEKEEWKNENARLDILRKRSGGLLSESEVEDYRELRRARFNLRRNPPAGLAMALTVSEVGPDARETFVLARGNPHSPAEKVAPGFPSVLSAPEPEIRPGPHGDTSGRRLALARWISDGRNPLTARVMANRIWQYHFGRGIVRSSSDFGYAGDKPTHPELLDWLARQFVEGGWKMKPIHRLILMSNTYKMSSTASAAGLKADPMNDLFWRYPMRRLQAEEVRDSVLAVNGTLNPKLGGPSFYQDLPEEVLAGQSRPGENWGKSSPEEQRRRSIYLHVKRSLAVPIIASFDGADTDFTCPVRFTTTQPTQALGMLNSKWLNDQARLFAAQLIKDAGESDEARIRLGLRRVLQREPTAPEVQRGLRLVQDLQQAEGMKPDEALSYFCLVALNLNEFLYLD